jgi:hypothetical protein
VVVYQRGEQTSQARVVMGKKSKAANQVTESSGNADNSQEADAMDPVAREELLERRIRSLEQEVRELRRLIEVK